MSALVFLSVFLWFRGAILVYTCQKLVKEMEEQRVKAMKNAIKAETT